MPALAITIDWSISLGSLLTLAGFMFGGISFIWLMKVEIGRMEVRLERLEEVSSKVADSIVELARHSERFNGLESSINDLRQRISNIYNLFNVYRNRQILDGMEEDARGRR